MALTLLPAAQANAAVEAVFPTSVETHLATATNGTTTLTFSIADAESIQVGAAVTGAGITSATVSAVNTATGVVTLTGTITTLTVSAYSFTISMFASLHTATPGLTGASEVTGGSYARQALSFGAPSSGVEASTNAQNFTLMPAVTVTYFGVWTASSAGTYMGGGLLSSSLTVPANATVVAAIGAITVSVQG